MGIGPVWEINSPTPFILSCCQTIVQEKSPFKSNIEKGGGEGNKNMVKCDNLPNKTG